MVAAVRDVPDQLDEDDHDNERADPGHVAVRGVVSLDTLGGTYGLAEEGIGGPAGAPESGAPA